jgi:hypothetical protein
MPNSRPFLNADLFNRYRDENGGACELAAEIGLEVARGGRLIFWPAGSLYIPAADTHHIFSVSGQRPDLKSCLIALSRPVHDRFHFGAKGDQAPLRVLFLCAKARKAARLGDPSEFNSSEIDIAAGRCVRGWAAGAVFEPAWAFVEPYRAELLARMSEIRVEERETKA